MEKIFDKFSGKLSVGFMKIGILFIISLALFSSCTPEKGKTKVSCDFGEAFDKVSQKCVSTRSAPATTIDNITLEEDSAPVIHTLQYNDPNGDKAEYCRVEESSAQIEVVAPVVFDDLYSQAKTLYNYADVVQDKVEALIAPSTGSVDVLIAQVETAFEDLKVSTLNSEIDSHLKTILNRATQIANVAKQYTVTSSYGDSLESLVNDFASVSRDIENRCQCVGGVCQIAVKPVKNAFGEFGITYVIVDPIDGESTSSQISINVQRKNDIPVATNVNVASFTEHTTSLARDYSLYFSNALDDIDGSIVSIDIEQPALGSVSGCQVIFGTDLSCTYRSVDGISNGVSGGVASNNLGNIRFEAIAYGSSGDSIQINFLEKTNIDFKEEIEISVSAQTINVKFWPNAKTATEISDAINADFYAGKLVQAAPLASQGSVIQVPNQSVVLNSSVDAYTSFRYRVLDNDGSFSEYAVANINIVANDDAPVLNTSGVTFSSTPSHFTSFTLNVPFTDEEGDALNTTCSISSNTSFHEESACTCSNVTNLCSIDLKPKYSLSGNLSLTLGIAQNSNPALTDSESITINVASAPTLAPYPVNHTASGTESSTALVTTSDYISVSTGAFIDSDVDPVYTYTIDSAPTWGTLSGCSLQSSGATRSLNCTYIPSNGNIFGTSTAGVSRFNLGTGASCLEVTALVGGTWSNAITIQTIDQVDMSSSEIFATVDGYDIQLYIDSGNTNCQQIADAINANPRAAGIISVTSPSPSTLVSAMGSSEAMTANVQVIPVNGVDSFTYSISDGSLSSHSATVMLDISAVNDAPVLCQYSSFNEAPECNNLNGCIGTGSPVGSITPKTVGIRYYEQQTATCYVSTGTSSNNDWQVATDDGIETITLTQREVATIKRIRIDEGGGTLGGIDEDSESLQIVSLTSSDTNLIPADAFNVRIYHGTNEVLSSGAYSNNNIEAVTTNSSDSEDIKIVITPVSSLVGESDLVLTLSDGTNTVDLSFKVVVNDVSATHGNWENVKAHGPLVNRVGIVSNQNYSCSYSKNSCNGGGECQGTLDPSVVSNAIAADGQNAIYYKSDTNECYVSNSQTTGDWTKVETYCQASASVYASGCTGESCIGNGSPIGSITPQMVDTQYWDRTNNICYQATGTTNNDWKSYTATGNVFLDWSAFSVNGGSIVGYNVYRKAPFEEYDFETPINKSTISAIQTYYYDNESNSHIAPTPNTVYQYQVKPIVLENGTSNQFVAPTTEIFQNLRVLVPGDNKSLVHRWMANKTQCEKMLLSPDSSNHYRCAYEGFGGTHNVPGSNYYDLGSDLIVDRFEAGCPFSKSPACTFSPDGTCLGINVPSASDSAVDGTIFYARESGKCLIRNAGAWNEFDGTQNLADYNRMELPPLVHTAQRQADMFCRTQSVSNIVGNCSFSIKSCIAAANPNTRENCIGQANPNGLYTANAGDFYYDESAKTCYGTADGSTWVSLNSNMAGSSRAKLPSRKEQISYSEWYLTSSSTESGTNDLLDSTATSYESGLGLDVQAKCNTSSADGLGDFFTDSDSPNSNALFTITATKSSSVRSIMTGSDYTNTCVSKFGLQDTIGNVSEWTAERFICANGAYTCTPILDSANSVYELNSTTNDLTYADGSDSVVNYNFDGDVGPCDDNGSGCGANLENWLFRGLNFNASRFSVAMGLPIDGSIPTTFATSEALSSFVQIGTSSGITLSQLHEDSINVNMNEISATTNSSRCGGLASGGSYLDGNGAGTYHFSLKPCEDDADTTGRFADVGFRCVIPAGGYLD
ncbi:hypothetical protein HBN50_08150 [Halobacteriovorax sp. GB3]|uniref:hypothetical protein n=1 Tax=Halobacteriovorax sp. GB3 TaxID=2719615 RepID=UPI00235E6F9D|nr:hypothetical protein [Halobacteriovorax sp. GB3]MDD0853064.1 hypothetical protein [Halobacteriovorax sp. GB3]